MRIDKFDIGFFTGVLLCVFVSRCMELKLNIIPIILFGLVILLVGSFVSKFLFD